MGEDKKNINDILEKLLVVTEAANEIFPEGKPILVYELNDQDFKKVQSNFRKIDINKLRFKIDISGTEIVFVNTKVYEETKDEEVKDEKKPSFFKRLFFRKSRESSVKK